MKRFQQQLFIVPFIIFLASCSSTHQHHSEAVNFDKQAHRGGRGLMPENTIASEENAIDFNCTLEMDLQMSKDKKIVVSHDPYFNSDFCLTPEGLNMTKDDGLSRLIFNMPYDSVIKYDVGLKPYPTFPQQKKFHTYKPLLSALIDSVEDYAKHRNHVNHYNIEIKSSRKNDGRTYPSLGEYIDSAMSIIIAKNIATRTMIQSFDVRALQIIRQKYPEMQIAFLVDKNNKKTAGEYIDELGFKPDIFSPEFSLVNEDLLNDFHKLHVLVIPWTPDSAQDIKRLASMGVDGVITDYPQLFATLNL